MTTGSGEMAEADAITLAGVMDGLWPIASSIPEGCDCRERETRVMLAAGTGKAFSPQVIAVNSLMMRYCYANTGM